MSESSTPAAAADEPAIPDAAGPDPATPESVTPESTAPAPVDPHLFTLQLLDPEPVTAVLAPVEAGPAGRHRRGEGGRSIVLSARTMALLRLARTVTPLVLVAGTIVACSTSSAPPAPPTARVERADVTTAVSSSGSLAAVTEQNLGFTKAGQIKTVEVKVGQKVTTGQVLATIDDGPPRRILEQQQGELDAQRATLTRLINATTVRGAQNSTNAAGDILSATRDEASRTVEADKSAVDRAEKQLDFDKDARDDAEDAADTANKACAASGGSSSGSSSSGSSGSGSSVDTAAILAGLGSLGSGDSDSDSDDSDDSESAAEKQKRIEAALKAAAALAGSLGASSATGSTTGSTSSACTQAASAQSTLAQAERQVETSRTSLDQARNKQKVDEASGRLQVQNAQQGVVTARNDLDSARTDRPSLIAEQRGLVAAQEAIVRSAQKDVDDTVLRAPVDGTVAAVNGAVGEFLTAGSTTTPLAPGSDGAIPGASAGTAAAAGATSRPGGTQFMVLDNVDQFEVVVPFEESDAIKISPNQKVNVSFDAIPDLTLPGTVVAVSPSASALSGVISYYATVALAQGDPRLKNGQTAEAAVLTTELDDVLTVPNSAVRRQGDRATVTVQQFDGQRTVEFQPGLVGDDRTQVLSGLTAGDDVVVPSGR